MYIKPVYLIFWYKMHKRITRQNIPDLPKIILEESTLPVNKDKQSHLQQGKSDFQAGVFTLENALLKKKQETINAMEKVNWELLFIISHS